MSAMHMLPRTLMHLRRAKRASRLGLTDVARAEFRVSPTDIDVLRHMNNGKYLSIMDVARFELMQRNGVLAAFDREGWYPVVVAQTITYRKSLNPWKRFAIESKVLGFDEQAVYMEQRFLRPDRSGSDEIYARAFVRSRILRRSGGVVPVDEIIERLGADPAEFHVSDDLLAWGRLSRLQSTREPAPNAW
ncbi:4-hydroxybenzoyl-CoA thioesterase [Leucobacter sp. OAMLP11]|nr:4-hydroxybenzoyl-CoA thioesterase [Leucobacter sp. OAMLP11]